MSAGVKSDGYHVLLQEEEYDVERKRKGSPAHIFDSIYWPVAGILGVAVDAILGAVAARK